MYNTLKNAVRLLFDEIPFSKRNEQLSEELVCSAEQKYNEDIQNGVSPNMAAGELLIHSDTVEDLCDYLKKDTQNSDDLTVSDKRTFVKTQRKLRRHCYALSFLLAYAANTITALCINASLTTLAVLIASLAVVAVLTLLVFKNRQRIIKKTNFFDAVFESDCRVEAAKKYDLYTKKLTNSVFISFTLIFIVLFSVLLSLYSFKYSFGEAVGTVNSYLFFILFMPLKSYSCRKLYSSFLGKRRNDAYSRELRKLCLFSSVYYALATVFLLIFRNKTENIFTYGLALAAVYLMFALFYNFTRRKNFTDKNTVLNWRKIICYTLCIACLASYNFMKLDIYLLQPYINTVSKVEHGSNEIKYNEDNGVYTLTAGSDSFKILQLTDIHLGGSFLSVSEDTKALTACRRLIEATAPDLVVVTGDLVFPMGIMSFSLNNNAPVMQFANFMRNIGVPWAFTYGNHDTEALATLSRAEMDELMRSLSYKTSENLLYPYIQPDIYGRSNQMIEIRGSDGELWQALFLIDSNDYVEGGTVNEYDCIHDDQVEWYRRTVANLSKSEGRTVDSMIFTHIPLREYKEANDLYENGSTEVTYYYGELGEKMIDKICCSTYESPMFDTAVELDSTKAIFCGHDHYNNQSLEYKGIRLTYGFSIDYLAMPGIEKDTDQRGATLITLQENGAFDITPYRLTELD